jgi:hypothetical protein
MAGKWMPVDENLGPHWATCKFVRQLRQPRSPKEQLAFLLAPPSTSS